jgi:hypothetical protein
MQFKEWIGLGNERENGSSKWFSAENVLALLSIGYVFIFVLLPFFGDGFNRIPGDLIDARFNNYVLEHGYKYLCREEHWFWSAPFMYPESKVITFSDNFLGELPFYAFFRQVGLDRETAYQCWMLVSFMLNFLVCAWVLAKLGCNRLSALLGAYVFAFALPVFDQTYHSQMISRYAMPLAFYFFIQFFEKTKPVYFLAFLLSVVWQFYNSIYLGFMLSLGIFCFGIFYLWFQYKDISFRTIFTWKKMAQCLVFISLALIPLYALMHPYVERAIPGYLPEHDLVMLTVPRLASYVLTSPYALSWLSLNNQNPDFQYYWNHFLFPGGLTYLAMIVVILIIVRQKFKFKMQLSVPMKRAAAILCGLALLIVLTIRVHGISAYETIFLLPGFKSMRDICRVVNVELFFWGTLVAFAASYLLAYARLPLRYVLTLLMFAGIVLDNRYDLKRAVTYSKTESQIQCGRLIEKIEQHPGYKNYEAMIYMPNDQGDHNICQLDAMLASQALGIKTVNSYTGNTPSFFVNFWINHNMKGLQEWFGHEKLPIDSTRFLIIR